jgi:hypothetical protein
MLVQQLRRTGARERQLAGDQFVNHATKAVDVGPFVGGLPADLLGRHVAVGALHRRLVAEQLADPFLGLAREVEVDQPDVIMLVDEEIIGLDIAMDPALLVHVLQGLGGLHQYRIQSPVEILQLTLNLLLQVRRLEQLHHHIRAVLAAVAEVVGLDDRWMIERLADFEFVLQLSGSRAVVARSGRQPLHGERGRFGHGAHGPDFEQRAGADEVKHPVGTDKFATGGHGRDGL